MRVGKYVLCFRCKGQFPRGRDLFPQQRSSLYFLADGLDRHLRTRKKASGKCLVLSHSPEKEMLRFNSRGTKLGGFITCKENYSARFFCVTFEHLVFCVEKVLMITKPGKNFSARQLQTL